MGVPERKSLCKLAEYTPILRVKAFNKKLYSLQRQEPARWSDLVLLRRIEVTFGVKVWVTAGAENQDNLM
jgi:hypothetical protein